jgi:hypothetical protein
MEVFVNMKFSIYKILFSYITHCEIRNVKMGVAVCMSVCMRLANVRAIPSYHSYFTSLMLELSSSRRLREQMVPEEANLTTLIWILDSTWFEASASSCPAARNWDFGDSKSMPRHLKLRLQRWKS